MENNYKLITCGYFVNNFFMSYNVNQLIKKCKNTEFILQQNGFYCKCNDKYKCNDSDCAKKVVDLIDVNNMLLTDLYFIKDYINKANHKHKNHKHENYDEYQHSLLLNQIQMDSAFFYVNQIIDCIGQLFELYAVYDYGIADNANELLNIDRIDDSIYMAGWLEWSKKQDIISFMQLLKNDKDRDFLQTTYQNKLNFASKTLNLKTNIDNYNAIMMKILKCNNVLDRRELLCLNSDNLGVFCNAVNDSQDMDIETHTPNPELRYAICCNSQLVSVVYNNGGGFSFLLYNTREFFYNHYNHNYNNNCNHNDNSNNIINTNSGCCDRFDSKKTINAQQIVTRTVLSKSQYEDSGIVVYMAVEGQGFELYKNMCHIANIIKFNNTSDNIVTTLISTVATDSNCDIRKITIKNLKEKIVNIELNIEFFISDKKYIKIFKYILVDDNKTKVDDLSYSMSLKLEALELKIIYCVLLVDSYNILRALGKKIDNTYIENQIQIASFLNLDKYIVDKITKIAKNIWFNNKLAYHRAIVDLYNKQAPIVYCNKNYFKVKYNDTNKLLNNNLALLEYCIKDLTITINNKTTSIFKTFKNPQVKRSYEGQLGISEYNMCIDGVGVQLFISVDSVLIMQVVLTNDTTDILQGVLDMTIQLDNTFNLSYNCCVDKIGCVHAIKKQVDKAMCSYFYCSDSSATYELKQGIVTVFILKAIINLDKMQNKKIVYLSSNNLNALNDKIKEVDSAINDNIISDVISNNDTTNHNELLLSTIKNNLNVSSVLIASDYNNEFSKFFNAIYYNVLSSVQAMSIFYNELDLGSVVINALALAFIGDINSAQHLLNIANMQLSNGFFGDTINGLMWGVGVVLNIKHYGKNILYRHSIYHDTNNQSNSVLHHILNLVFKSFENGFCDNLKVNYYFKDIININNQVVLCNALGYWLCLELANVLDGEYYSENLLDIASNIKNNFNNFWQKEWYENLEENKKLDDLPIQRALVQSIILCTGIVPTKKENILLNTAINLCENVLRTMVIHDQKNNKQLKSTALTIAFLGLALFKVEKKVSLILNESNCFDFYNYAMKLIKISNDSPLINLTMSIIYYTIKNYTLGIKTDNVDYINIKPFIEHSIKEIFALCDFNGHQFNINYINSDSENTKWQLKIGNTSISSTRFKLDSKIQDKTLMIKKQ